MALNRFLLFVYEYWEPCGGWEDYAGAFASEVEARQAGETLIEEKSGNPPCYAFHITDLVLCEIIHTSPRPTE